jgi:beta-lactamase superfamily II metal-dependent hydrolase
MRRLPDRCASHRLPRQDAARSFLRAARAVALLALPLLFASATALAQGNGKLQIHHIKVGQGDGMLVISPNGETAVFDNGVYTNCAAFTSYISGLGITSIKYSFSSHYHADHIGCLDDLLAGGVTLNVAAWDRGLSYSSATYTNYVNAVGTKRRTMVQNQVVQLDSLSANPVYLKCVGVNGAGVYSPSGSDENAKSLVVKVSYGAFDEVIGGDLTGDGSLDV